MWPQRDITSDKASMQSSNCVIAMKAVPSTTSMGDRKTSVLSTILSRILPDSNTATDYIKPTRRGTFLVMLRIDDISEESLFPLVAIHVVL